MRHTASGTVYFVSGAFLTRVIVGFSASSGMIHIRLSMTAPLIRSCLQSDCTCRTVILHLSAASCAVIYPFMLMIRTMIINGLAEALLTTPEWLTGLSDDKEYSIYTVCQMDLEKHIKGYLETVTSTVNGEPHQQLLTTFLGQIVDLYTILTKYWAVSMKKVDEVAEDEGLKESIGKYAIHIGSITEQVYQKEMEVPIEDMKRYLDGILHLYDEGRTKVSIPELFGIVDQAKQKLIEKGT